MSKLKMKNVRYVTFLSLSPEICRVLFPKVLFRNLLRCEMTVPLMLYYAKAEQGGIVVAESMQAKGELLCTYSSGNDTVI